MSPQTAHGASEAVAVPPIVDQATWEAALAELRVREKAATRELDAIAAARRRQATPDGRTSRIHRGQRRRPGSVGRCIRRQAPAGRVPPHVVSGEEWQCPGCTGFTSEFTRLEYLDSYDARFVLVTQGPIDEALAYKARVGNKMTWYSTANSPFGADMGAPPGGGFQVNVYLRDGDTVYRPTTRRAGEPAAHPQLRPDRPASIRRREEWQDSPEGWPKTPAYSGWKSSEAYARDAEQS